VICLVPTFNFFSRILGRQDFNAEIVSNYIRLPESILLHSFEKKGFQITVLVPTFSLQELFKQGILLVQL